MGSGVLHMGAWGLVCVLCTGTLVGVPQELCTWRPSGKDAPVGVASDLMQRRAGGCGAAEHLWGVVWALELYQRVVRLSPVPPRGSCSRACFVWDKHMQDSQAEGAATIFAAERNAGPMQLKNRRRLLLSGRTASAFAQNSAGVEGVCIGPVPDT